MSGPNNITVVNVTTTVYRVHLPLTLPHTPASPTSSASSTFTWWDSAATSALAHYGRPAPWFQRKNIVFLIWMLLIYSIVSLLVIVMLLGKGVLDWKGDLHLKRDQRQSSPQQGDGDNDSAFSLEVADGSQARTRPSARQSRLPVGQNDQPLPLAPDPPLPSQIYSGPEALDLLEQPGVNQHTGMQTYSAYARRAERRTAAAAAHHSAYERELAVRRERQIIEQWM